MHAFLFRREDISILIIIPPRAVRVNIARISCVAGAIRLQRVFHGYRTEYKSPALPNGRAETMSVIFRQAPVRSKKSNLGNFDLDLLADLCGTADTVDDRLVDDDLRSRDGGFGVIYGSVEEGSHLLLKEVAGAEDRYLGLGACVAHVMIQSHGTADRAVPAIRRRNAECAFLTEDYGVTGGVGMHCPRNTEVEDYSALKTNECCSEIVNAESLCIRKRSILGVLPKEIGGVAGYGKRLRISDGVEHHIERIASDITECADTCGLILDKSTSRNTAAAASSGLDIVDLTESTGLTDALDHSHVCVKAGLEADGNEFPGALLGASHLDSLIKRYAHRLLEKTVASVLKRVDRAAAMLAVVGADAYNIEVFLLEHFEMVRISSCMDLLVRCEEIVRFSGDYVGACDDLHIVKLKVLTEMRPRDRSGTDYSYSDLLIGHFIFLLNP